MSMFLCFFFILSCILIVVSGQAGENGEYCGDTGLGARSGLLNTVRGYGTLNLGVDTGLMTISIDDNQLVSFLHTNNMPPVKHVECVYDVTINYETSIVYIVTGPVNARGNTVNQRCWTLTMNDENENILDIGRTAVGTDCNGQITEVGTINPYYTENHPHGGSNCNDLTNGVPNQFHSNSGNFRTGIRIMKSNVFSEQNPNSVSMTVGCISNVNYHAESGVYRLTTQLLNSNCILYRPSLQAGTYEIKKGNANLCSANTPDMEGATLYPAVFPNWRPQTSAAPSPGASVAPEPSVVPVIVKLKVVEVVKFELGLTLGPGVTVSSFISTCNLQKLRAFAAQRGNVDPSLVNILSITVDGVELSFDPVSPGNSGTCDESSGSSRLLSPHASHVRSAVKNFLRTASLDEFLSHPRVLAGETVGIEFQVVIPPSGSAASLTAAFGEDAGAWPAFEDMAIVLNAAPSTGSGEVIDTDEEQPLPNRYIPDPIFSFFNKLPRFSYTGVQVTNEFSLDKEYIEGVASPPIGIFVFAAIVVVTFSTVYICSCCRCCRRRSKCRRPYGAGEARITARGVFLALMLLNVGILLGALYYSRQFHNGVRTLFRGMDEVVSVLDESRSLLNSPDDVSYNGTTFTSMSTSLTLANTHADTCVDLCVGPPACSAAIDSILDSIQSGTAEGVDSISDVSLTIGDTVTEIKDIRADIDEESLVSHVNTATIIIFVGLAILVAFPSVMICRTRTAHILFKTFVPLLLLVTFIVLVLSGVSMALAVAGSDVCKEPHVLLSNELESMDLPELASDTIRYYLNCGNQPSMAPVGALQLLEDNIHTVELAAEQSNSLYAEIVLNPTSPAYGGLGSSAAPGYMAANMTAAFSTISYLQDSTLSCARIDRVVTTLLQSLCNEGFATLGYLFRILIASGVFLTLQLAVASRLCCAHPGMIEEEDYSSKGNNGQVLPQTNPPVNQSILSSHPPQRANMNIQYTNPQQHAKQI